MDIIKLDFEQARAKHLLFKSKLRSILYGAEVDEAPVLSHHECAVGKWIYGHALEAYGHIAEMNELERTHADIHTSARNLVSLFKEGKVEEARAGLSKMESIADNLVELLQKIENKIEHKNAPTQIKPAEISFAEFDDLLKSNVELDKRIKLQVEELAKMKERFDLIAKATQDAVWDWDIENNTLWWNNGFREIFGYEKIETGLDSRLNKIHHQDKERVEKSLNEVLKNKGPRWVDEYRFLKADGTYAHVHDRGYVIYKDAKPYRMVGSIVDFSERKKSEENLKRAYEDLELKVTFRNMELEKANKENLAKLEELQNKLKASDDARILKK